MRGGGTGNTKFHPLFVSRPVSQLFHNESYKRHLRKLFSRHYFMSDLMSESSVWPWVDLLLFRIYRNVRCDQSWVRRIKQQYQKDKLKLYKI